MPTIPHAAEAGMKPGQRMPLGTRVSATDAHKCHGTQGGPGHVSGASAEGSVSSEQHRGRPSSALDCVFRTTQRKTPLGAGEPVFEAYAGVLNPAMTSLCTWAHCTWTRICMCNEKSRLRFRQSAAERS